MTVVGWEPEIPVDGSGGVRWVVGAGRGMVEFSDGIGSVGGGIGERSGLTGREAMASVHKILFACSFMKSLSQDERVL